MILGSTRRVLVMVGVAAALALLPACSDVDPIPPSTGSIAFSVQASPTGTGRYESVVFPITYLRIRALDAANDAYFAGRVIQLVPDAVRADLSPSGELRVQAAALPPGRYRTDQLRLAAPTLLDATVPLPAPTRCIENLARVPATTGAQIPTLDFFSSQLTGPNWEFEIGAGPQEIVFNVDAPAFVNLVENSFTCDDSTGTARLTAFNSSAYRTGLVPLLSLRK